MSDNITIEFLRDEESEDYGTLTICYRSRSASEPIGNETHFPIMRAAASRYADVIGKVARPDYPGVYSVTDDNGYSRKFGLMERGDTLPCKVMDKPIPCPKVRKDTQTIYMSYRWHKWTSRGWVAIG